MPGLDQQLRVTLFLCSGLCNKTHQTGRLINNRKLSHHSGVWKSESRTPAFSAEGRPPGSQPAPPPCPPREEGGGARWCPLQERLALPPRLRPPEGCAPKTPPLSTWQGALGFQGMNLGVGAPNIQTEAEVTAPSRIFCQSLTFPHGRAVLLGPLTLLLSARVPLPHKVSYSVSSCVSSDTSFPSIRQEPTFGPWKRTPFLQQLHPQASSLHLRGAKAERKGVREQLCAPASSDLLSCAFSLSVLPSLALQERGISQTLPAPFLYVCLTPTLGFPGGSDSKESACDAGDQGSIPGSGRSPGEGKGNPLQYSCLENPMDRGACQATVPGVGKSQT